MTQANRLPLMQAGGVDPDVVARAEAALKSALPFRRPERDIHKFPGRLGHRSRAEDPVRQRGIEAGRPGLGVGIVLGEPATVERDAHVERRQRHTRRGIKNRAPASPAASSHRDGTDRA